jgi:hypothetical protein
MRSLFLILLLLMATTVSAGETNAKQLVKDSMDHWRGLEDQSHHQGAVFNDVAELDGQ